MPKFTFLATDVILLLLLAATAFYVWHALRTPTLRQTWRVVARDASAMSAAVVLGVFLLIAVLDSFHYRPLLPAARGVAAATRMASSCRRTAGQKLALTNLSD